MLVVTCAILYDATGTEAVPQRALGIWHDTLRFVTGISAAFLEVMVCPPVCTNSTATDV